MNNASVEGMESIIPKFPILFAVKITGKIGQLHPFSFKVSLKK